MTENRSNNKKYQQNRLLDLNGQSLRVSSQLAIEIGFNESLLFLQLEYLIAISKHEREGQRWTYQSVTDLKEMFLFWSTSTIKRAIKSLEKKKLITVGNFNRKKYDRTRWFAINAEEARKLKSIRFDGSDVIEQIGPATAQFEPASAQNVPTIPNTTTDNTSKKNNSDKDHAQSKASPSNEQPSLTNLNFVSLSPGETDPSNSNNSAIIKGGSAAREQKNEVTAAPPDLRRPRLRDNGSGPVQRIFDFHCKATGRKRAQLTDEIRKAIASRISSKVYLNPSGYTEDDIKLAILGCLASRDSRDAFFFEHDDSGFNDFISQDEDAIDSIYLAERREKEPEGYRWKTDLKHICAFADRVARFLNIAEQEGFTVEDVRIIEQERNHVAA